MEQKCPVLQNEWYVFHTCRKGRIWKWWLCKVCKTRHTFISPELTLAAVKSECRSLQALQWNDQQPIFLESPVLQTYGRLMAQTYLRYGQVQTSCDVLKRRWFLTEGQSPSPRDSWRPSLLPSQPQRGLKARTYLHLCSRKGQRPGGPFISSLHKAEGPSKHPSGTHPYII